MFVAPAMAREHGAQSIHELGDITDDDFTTCIFEIGRIQILQKWLPKKYKKSKKIYRMATMVENRVIFCKYYVHMCSVVKVPVYAKE